MTERNPTVVVTSDETLPDIVARLREAANGGHTVDLVIPIDSALLLTAREFRTLKDAIDEDRVAVQMRTADPLRLQLAERLGIPARALPRPRRRGRGSADSCRTASGRCGTDRLHAMKIGPARRLWRTRFFVRLRNHIGRARTA